MYILDMWQKYSLGVLFIVDIFVNGLICAAHSFVRFIKLVDSINWVFIGIHILFSALCAFACTARIKGTGREREAVSLLLCHASYTGGDCACSYQLCTVVNCCRKYSPSTVDEFQFQEEYSFMSTIESFQCIFIIFV